MITEEGRDMKATQYPNFTSGARTAYQRLRQFHRTLQRHSPVDDSGSLAPLTDENIWSAHRQLAAYNRKRIEADRPSPDWRTKIRKEAQMRELEGEILSWEIAQIQEQASTAPKEPDAFMEWFEDLKHTGPGQNTALFNWLATSADEQQMTWFVQQEVAGEAGFDDLAALTQLKLPTRAKLEVARNYWDEMGRGKEIGMHGPMLTRLAEELGVAAIDQNRIVTEALALGNVLLGFAVNRRFAYHSIGALGAVELTAPGRAELVYQGLKRLGVSPEGQRYYRLHSKVDIKHSEDWNREVIHPLVTDDPTIIPLIAEGALVRLHSGARCFNRYQQILGLSVRL